MDISKVLDEAKAALNIDTDYKLAKALELPNGYITLWRQGSRIPDAYACARLAEVLGINPLELIAQVEAETEKNETRRTYWKKVAERMAAGTAASFFIVGVLSNDARADENDLQQTEPYCFQKSRKWGAWLASALQVVKQFVHRHLQGAGQSDHGVSRHLPSLIHVAV